MATTLPAPLPTPAALNYRPSRPDRTARPGRVQQRVFLPADGMALAAPLPCFFFFLFFLFGNQCVSYYPALPCPAAGRAEQWETPCWLSSQARAKKPLRGSFHTLGAPRPPPGPRPRPPRGAQPRAPAPRTSPGRAGGMPPPPRASGGRGLGGRHFPRRRLLPTPGPRPRGRRMLPRRLRGTSPGRRPETGPGGRLAGPGRARAPSDRARSTPHPTPHPAQCPPRLVSKWREAAIAPSPPPHPVSPRTIVAFRV